MEEPKEYYVSMWTDLLGSWEWMHVVEQRFSKSEAETMLNKLSKKYKKTQFRLDEVPAVTES